MKKTIIAWMGLVAFAAGAMADSTVGGNLTVGGTTTLNGPVNINGTLSTGSNSLGGIPVAQVSGSAQLAGNQFGLVTATAASAVVWLPAGPKDGTLDAVKLMAISGTNTAVVRSSGSDTINLSGTQYGLTLVNQAALFQYYAAARQWLIRSDDVPIGSVVTQTSGTMNGTTVVPAGQVVGTVGVSGSAAVSGSASVSGFSMTSGSSNSTAWQAGGNPTATGSSAVMGIVNANTVASAATLSGTAPGSAAFLSATRTNPATVVYASQIPGIHLDGTNDDTTVLRAVLGSATNGIELVMDGTAKAVVSGTKGGVCLPLLSHTHIRGMNRAVNGFRMADNSHADVLANAHETPWTALTGTCDQDYLIENLTIDQGNDNARYGGPSYFDPDCIKFQGATSICIRNITCINCDYFGVCVGNCNDVRILHMLCWFDIYHYNINNDAIHIQGGPSAYNIYVEDLWFNGMDDAVGIDADDAQGGGFAYEAFGPLHDVTVKNVTTYGVQGVRVLSLSEFVDNINIDGVYGAPTNFAISVGSANNPGPFGRLGKVSIRNVNVSNTYLGGAYNTLVNSDYQPTWCVIGISGINGQRLTIDGVQVNGLTDNRPIFYIGATCNIKNITINNVNTGGLKNTLFQVESKRLNQVTLSNLTTSGTFFQLTSGTIDTLMASNVCAKSFITGSGTVSSLSITGTTSPPYPNIANTPYAYWTLSGSLTSTGTASGCNLTAYNSPGYATGYLSSQCIALNGTNQYLQSGTLPLGSGTSMSYVAWVKTSLTGTQQSTSAGAAVFGISSPTLLFVSQMYLGYSAASDAAGEQFWNYINLTSGGWQGCGSANAFSYYRGFKDGNWHMVGMRYLNGVGEAIVDGCIIGRTYATGTQFVSGAAAFSIGDINTGSYWPGWIQNVGFWQGYLSDADIAEIYSAGLGKVPPYLP